MKSKHFEELFQRYQESDLATAVSGTSLTKAIRAFLREEPEELVEKLGLTLFLQLDPSELPVPDDDELGFIAHRLATQQPETFEEFAARFRELVWRASTVGSGLNCPTCDSQLHLLRVNQMFVLRCYTCSFAEDEHGRQVEPADWRAARPPTAREVELWRAEHSGLVS